MSLQDSIAKDIATATGRGFHCAVQQPVAGGCINNAFTVSNNSECYFVKTNSADKADMFTAEAAGLNEIAATGSIKVPRVICSGIAAGQAYLVLEQLELGNTGDAAQLGKDLAQMHRHTARHYGWQRDNTIGSTPQINKQTDNWVAFWREQRLGFQLSLAKQNGYAGKLQQMGKELCESLDYFFTDHNPEPSLLHGDLWSGNYAFDNNGTPVIFDPAIYYGDRETDMAMTELFGGFAAGFYQAYENEYPLGPGYSQRKTLYNLYHILNHLNLFGGGYLGQAESMLARLLGNMR